MRYGLRSQLGVERLWRVSHRTLRLLTTQTESSNSSRSALHDSPVSDLISKCNSACPAVPRADELDAIGSTECCVPPSDAEVDTGEVVKAASLRHFPSVSSPDPIRFVERSEQRPSQEVDSTWNPESLYALSRLENDEFRPCLSEAGMVKAKRRRLRSDILRARRSSFEPANQELPPEMDAFGLTSSPEHGSLTVDRDRVKSAGQEVASYAVVPVATPLLCSQRLTSGLSKQSYHVYNLRLKRP
ncbi:hypothetical protein FS837_005104, partial [Tulasnella sp. UAMH 9824]